MSIREGLYVSLGGDHHLDSAVVYLVGYPAPFIFVGCYQLTDQGLKLPFARSKLGSAVCDPLLKGCVELPNLIFDPLALGNVVQQNQAASAVPLSICNRRERQLIISPRRLLA
jgi:hypothetical protein